MLAAARRRATFSNVVALLALFVALGGTAYAAKKLSGKSLIASSVTGKKLKKNTLTGREVNESKLGVVPHATLADTLGDKTAADFAPAGAVLSSGLVKLQLGEERTLLSRGPFSFRLTCKDLGGGNTQAQILVKSSEAGSLNFITEMTPETDMVLTGISAPGKGVATTSNAYLAAPSGTALTVVSSVAYINILNVPCAGTLKAIP